MPPAPASGAVDPFTATRTRMEEMLAHLSAPVIAAATAQALEEYITEAGRELLRQVLQDQFDARAAAEARLAAVAGTDAVVRRRAERGHRRLLSTTLGRVEVTRIAYRAQGAPNLHPADAALALPTGIHSYPLQRAIALEAAEGPLRQAGARLAGPPAGVGPPAADRRLMAASPPARLPTSTAATCPPPGRAPGVRRTSCWCSAATRQAST